MNLEDFLASGSRSEWINYETLDIYVRASRRLLLDINPDRLLATFDVANVSSAIPGQGAFWAFLDHLKETLPREYKAI